MTQNYEQFADQLQDLLQKFSELQANSDLVTQVTDQVSTIQQSINDLQAKDLVDEETMTNL